MGVMGEGAHRVVGRTGRDGQLVARLRRSRVMSVCGAFPDLSTRRPWAVLLRSPDGAAMRRSWADATRRIRTVQRVGGAEGNLSRRIEEGAGVSRHSER